MNCRVWALLSDKVAKLALSPCWNDHFICLLLFESSFRYWIRSPITDGRGPFDPADRSVYVWPRLLSSRGCLAQNRKTTPAETLGLFSEFPWLRSNTYST